MKFLACLLLVVALAAGQYDREGPPLRIDGVMPGMLQADVEALLGPPMTRQDGVDGNPALTECWYPPGVTVLYRSTETAVEVVAVLGTVLSQGGQALLDGAADPDRVVAVLGEPDGRTPGMFQYALPGRGRLLVDLRRGVFSLEP